MKYVLLVPLFVGIAGLVTLTPLNVVVVDVILFVTGFSQIFTFHSHNLIQEVSVMVYQAFYHSFGELGVRWLIWLCRAFSGMFVASLALLIMNRKDQEETSMRKRFVLSNPFVSSFFASLFGLFIAVPSAIAQLSEIQEFPWINCVVIMAAVLVIALLPLFNINAKGFKYGFIISYVGLVIIALTSKLFSESFVMVIFLLMLWLLPQTMIVFAFIISALFLVILVNVRYSLVTISYQSAIATFSLLAVLFVARYQMVKISCLRRLTKRAKVEYAGCKVNNSAFGLEENEIDIFLMEEPDAEKESALVVYESLGQQMYIFVGLAVAILYQWNFYPLIAILFALLVLLIPVDSRDQDGKITQVAGFFGVTEGWHVTELNKLRLK